MSTLMAKKRKGVPLNIWIDPALRKAIRSACEISRRKAKDEVSIALEEYLAKLRLWPPQERAPKEAP